MIKDVLFERLTKIGEKSQAFTKDIKHSIRKRRFDLSLEKNKQNHHRKVLWARMHALNS